MTFALQLIHCLNVILGVMKRCQWPDDVDVARRGGFQLPGGNGANGCDDGSGAVRFRNPATPHIMELLDNVLALMRCVVPSCYATSHVTSSACGL